MVSGTIVSVEAALLESLASDLCEVADLAAELAAPEHADAARLTRAAWSPDRLARTIADGYLARA